MSKVSCLKISTIYRGLLKAALFAAISFLVPIYSLAQTSFQKTYGSIKNEDGFCIRQTTDGGYVIGGIEVIDSLNTDIYLIKTDSLGDTLWVKHYGGLVGDIGEAVQQTSDGGYVLVGSTYSYGAGQGDIFVIKTNSNGDTTWTRTYGGAGDEIGEYIQETNDGGFIIGGHTDSFGPRGDFYLIKIKANGDTLWSRNYGGIKHDHGFCVQQTSDNGYFVVGHSLSFGASGGYYAVKTNSNGDTLWTRGYGGATDSYCLFGQQTTDGGYILTGFTDCFGAGGTDAWVVKTNSVGDTVWTKTYGGMGSDYFNCVKQTPDGGYILVGSTTSFGFGNTDVYLVKINSTGDTLWSKTLGGIYEDDGMHVCLTLDGGYVITGSTKSFGNGGFDVYLIKTDKNGNTDCYSTSALTQITQPAALVLNVPTLIGLPNTLVGNAPFLIGTGANLVSDVCGSIGIEFLDKEKNSDIKIYPSPSTGYISIQAGEQLGLINLYDCQGKLVHQQKSTNLTMMMDVSDLQSGIYILHVHERHIMIVKE